MNQKKKKELALEIISRLKKEYPDAGCTLDYNEAWKLLVSVRLAAQCTDARVNVIVEKLYEKFPNVDALADARVEDIEAIVRPCGLGRTKARDISACMKVLKEKYQGKVPNQFKQLLDLPGVGRKSANLIMGDVFGEPAIVTDTHCIRLVNRMGLVDGIREPKKVEMELWKIIPPEEGSDFCHRLVFHGREICTARTKPFCDRCCLNDICERSGVDEPEKLAEKEKAAKKETAAKKKAKAETKPRKTAGAQKAEGKTAGARKTGTQKAKGKTAGARKTGTQKTGARNIQEGE